MRYWWVRIGWQSEKFDTRDEAEKFAKRRAKLAGVEYTAYIKHQVFIVEVE